MRTRRALVCSLALTTVFFAGAQAYEYTETHFVSEPWSGWWWPAYHDTLDTSWCCPHLWQGPNIEGGEPGPIYDLDTKYFWRSEPRRDSTQAGSTCITGFSEADRAQRPLDTASPETRICSGVTMSETWPRGASGIAGRSVSPALTGGAL